jgi:alpha-1,3-fucosyltransferase
MEELKTLEQECSSLLLWIQIGKIGLRISQVCGFTKVAKLKKHSILDTKLMEIIKNKTRTAAWFVSNCEDSPSQRQKLIKQLQKFIPIEIYGGCGSRCPRPPRHCRNLNHYWFYMSFENSLCTDYVTEKVYNKMYQNAVVVLFNGANMTKFLPPHSYIDANDFKTPKDLAKYLIHLTKNPNEYLQYFWWRRHYSILSDTRQDYRRICNALNSPEQEEKKVYGNMTEWLFKSCKVKPRIKF